MNLCILIINLILIAYDMLLYFKCKEKSFILYCICTIICPRVHIGGSSISFEILGFCGILLVTIADLMGHSLFYWNKKIIPQLLYFIIFIISTGVSIVNHVCNIDYIRLFAYFRYTFIIVFFVSCDIRRYMIPLLKFLLFVEICVTLFQIIFPSSMYFFFPLYINNEGMIWLFTMSGRITRVFGTFKTPVALGIFSAISIVEFSVDYLYGTQNKNNLVWIIIAMVTGVASTTKSFFLSLAIIGVYLLINNRRIRSRLRRRNLLRGNSKFPVFLVGFLFGIISVFIILSSTGISNIIKYYFNNAFMGFRNSLEIRYGGQNTSGTIDAMLSSMNGYEKIIGVGSTTPYEEPLRDSEWGSLYHGAGLIGLSILLLWMIYLLILSEKKAQYNSVLIIILLGANALGSGFFLSVFGMIMIIYVIQSCELVDSQRKNKKNEPRQAGSWCFVDIDRNLK